MVIRKGFFVPIPNIIFTLKSLDHSAVRIWCHIFSQPSDWSSSRNNIAKNLGIDPKTVSLQLGVLEEFNMLKMTPGRGGAFDFEMFSPEEWTCPDMPREGNIPPEPECAQGKYTSTSGGNIPPQVGEIYPYIKEAIIQQEQEAFASSEKNAKIPTAQKITRKAKGAIAELQDFSDYLSGVSQDLQYAWIMRYKNVTLIKAKIQDLIQWELANPTRAKRNKGNFINNCLRRDLGDRMIQPSEPAPLVFAPVRIKR